MSQTVQSSFSAACPIDECNKVILSCGNNAYNNFVYGVKQNIDYFSFIKSKIGVEANCNIDLINNVISKLGAPIPSPQSQVTNQIHNTTIVNQDSWDSIEW